MNRGWCFDGAMLSTAFGDRHVIRFEPGEEVLDALRRFITEHGVGYSFASAIGGVCWIRLGYWDVQKKEYRHTDLEEQLEVLSLTGDTSRKDGKPHLHLHGVFGRPDYTTVGGHVMACRAYPTLELWLRTESLPLQREHDTETGLDLLDLDSRT